MWQIEDSDIAVCNALSLPARTFAEILMMRFFLFAILTIGAFGSCSINNVKKDESLKRFFDARRVQGTFAIFDNGIGKFTICNLKRYRDSSFMPGSTFEIVNSLVGLQTGKISGDSMLIRWDGVNRRVGSWNKDLNLHDAFTYSAMPYDQAVARSIGRDTMQLWLDSLSYGSKKIKSAIDTFWLDNSLKISPDEQLGLVKKLYFAQLPFFDTYEAIVKRVMLVEDNANYKLSFNTGVGMSATGNKLGWIVGWIEENKHPYFFVLNFDTPDGSADIDTIGKSILKDILKELGFMQGKM